MGMVNEPDDDETFDSIMSITMAEELFKQYEGSGQPWSAILALMDAGAHGVIVVKGGDDAGL